MRLNLNVCKANQREVKEIEVKKLNIFKFLFLVIKVTSRDICKYVTWTISGIIISRNSKNFRKIEISLLSQNDSFQ